MRVALCLLTWNELPGCHHDVPHIKRDQFDYIFAVDGGSNDGTVEYLQQEGIHVLRQPKISLNAAHVHAVENCPCDAIIFFHPKGSVPVEDTLKFKAFFEAGYELIVASRNISGGRNEEDKKLLKPRKWLSLGLAHFASILWRREGRIIYDVLHGFRGMTVSAFKRMNILDTGLSIDIESVIRSYKLNIKRIEFPTVEKERLHGTSHFAIWPTGKKLMRYLAYEIFRRNETL